MQTPKNNKIEKATKFIIYFFATISVIIQISVLYTIFNAANYNSVVVYGLLIFLGATGFPTLVGLFYIYLRAKYNPIKIKNLSNEITEWLDKKSYWWFYDDGTLWLKNKQKAMEFKLTWGSNL